MGNVSLSELGLNFVNVCLSTYWGPLWFFWVFLAGILLTLFYRKRETAIFFPYTLFLFLTIYNPIIVKYFYSLIGSATVYYRFFWLLPVSAVIAYWCVKAVYITKNMLLRFFTGAILILAIFLAGVPIKKIPQELILPDNYFKMPDALLTICQIIHDDSEDESPRIVIDASLHMLVRQYDASLILTVDRDNMLRHSGSTTVYADQASQAYKDQAILLDAVQGGRMPSPEAFDSIIQKTDTDYIIITAANQAADALTNLGYTNLGEHDGYLIYRT